MKSKLEMRLTRNGHTHVGIETIHIMQEFQSKRENIVELHGRLALKTEMKKLWVS